MNEPRNPGTTLNLERVSDLARRALGVSLASVRFDEHSRLLLGVPEPVPISDVDAEAAAFLDAVYARNTPLLIPDTRASSLMENPGGFEGRSFGACAGVPIRLSGGQTVGTLAVFQGQPRDWSGDERAILEDLAQLAADQVMLRLEIADRDRTDGERLLVVRELEHRARNAFSIVQAVISLSMRDRSLLPLKLEIIDRIASVSATQDLIADQLDGIVYLRDILDRELAPLAAAERHQMRGPEVAIAPNEAVFVGMILHELMTNAVKHGALRGDMGGHLAIDWSSCVIDGHQTLSLSWRESGDRAEEGDGADMQSRIGFGSELLDILVTNQLKGSMERSYSREGLTIAMVLKLAVPQSGQWPRTAA